MRPGERADIGIRPAFGPARDEPYALAEIVDGAGYAIITESLDGIVTNWNKAAEILFGYAADEMIGRPAAILAPPERVGEDRELLDRVRRGRSIKDFETFRRRKDGSDLHVALSLSPICNRAGSIVGATRIIRDVTERRRAEAALRASEARFAAMFQQAVVGVAVVDGAGRFVMTNQRFRDILGRSEAELVGLRIVAVTHPEDRSSTVAALRNLLTANQTYVIDKRYVRPDGSAVWVNVSASLIVDPKTGERQIVGVVQDITDRKEAELALVRLNETLEQRVEERTREREAVKQQLYHAQKMEAIGQLTGGVAHDFNNLLTIIGGNLELLDDLVGGGDPPARKLIETARRGVERAERVVGQLLAFSRRQALRPRTVNLNDVLTDFAELVARAVGDPVRVRYDGDPGLLPCRVDPAQFQSALLNLAVNARDAMPDGGELMIETRNIDLDAEQAARFPEIAAGTYAAISVSDTGAGIPPELLDRIFEPFFTTKTMGKGTGLGLAQVYGFVRQSGGTVTIDSKIGSGTTIRILLPAAAEASGASEPSPRPAEAPRGHETVLVVEDDEDLLQLARTWLESLGYRTLGARSGPEALDLLQREPGRSIDAMITDLMMPGGITGTRLAQTARELRPGLAVLLTSGSVSAKDAAAAAPGFGILRKPYTRGDLAGELRTSLDAADASPTPSTPASPSARPSDLPPALACEAADSGKPAAAPPGA